MTDTSSVNASGKKGSKRDASLPSSAAGRIILPKSNGKWEDETKRGECMWYPGLPDDTNQELKPKKSNPQGLTWREIKEKYGFKGVEFKKKNLTFALFPEVMWSLNKVNTHQKEIIISVWLTRCWLLSLLKVKTEK